MCPLKIRYLKEMRILKMVQRLCGIMRINNFIKPNVENGKIKED